LAALKSTILSDSRFSEYHERIGALSIGSLASIRNEPTLFQSVTPVPVETVKPDERFQTPAPSETSIPSQSDFSEFAAIVRSLAEDRNDKSEAVQNDARSIQAIRWRLMAIVSAIMLIVGGLLFAVSQYSRGEIERVAFIPPKIDSTHSTIRGGTEPVALPRFDQIRDIGAIASLAYDLDNSDFEKRGVVPPRVAKSQPVAANSSRPREEISLPQAVETLTIKESTEPSEVRELQQRPEPEHNENVIDFPPYRNKPQPTPGLFGTTAPNGAVLVQRLSPPKLFTTIVATDIRPRPSYVGATIGALPSGDTVSVDTLFGPWARIILSSGRPGYVLMQDLAALP
jgi:hypothetical protein